MFRCKQRMKEDRYRKGKLEKEVRLHRYAILYFIQILSIPSRTINHYDQVCKEKL